MSILITSFVVVVLIAIVIAFLMSARDIHIPDIIVPKWAKEIWNNDTIRWHLNDPVRRAFVLFYLVLYSVGVYIQHNSTTPTNISLVPLTWSQYFGQVGAWSVAWPSLIILMMVCHVATAWESIDERSQGVIKFSGYVFKRRYDSGPQFVPWPTMLIILPKNPIKLDWGTWRKEDQKNIEEAEKSPTWFIRSEARRIGWPSIKNMNPPATAEQLKALANSPTAGDLFTDPRGYFTYKIYDPVNFIIQVGSIIEANDRILATIMAVLQEEAGKTCLALALGRLNEFSQRMTERVSWLIGDPDAIAIPGKQTPKTWGIDLDACHLTDFGTAHGTNKALVEQTAAIAIADGEATAATLKSEGERNRLINEGTGRAAAKKADAVAQEAFLAAEGRGQAAAALAKGKAANEVLEGQGLAEAAALKALGEAASSDGAKEILRLRALEAGLKTGKVTLVARDLGGVADMLIAGKEILDGVSDKK